jgi:hypothetical protein
MKLISAAVETFSPTSVETALIDAPLILTHVLEQKLTARGLTVADLYYLFREYSLVKRIILTYTRTTDKIIKLIPRNCLCQISFDWQ